MCYFLVEGAVKKINFIEVVSVYLVYCWCKCTLAVFQQSVRNFRLKCEKERSNIERPK